jgi:hypothetical protein
MLAHALRGVGKRLLRSKIHQRARQPQRSAAMTQRMTGSKRAQEPAALFQPPDLLDDFDIPEDALPLEFFLACLLAPGGGWHVGRSCSSLAQPPKRRRPNSRMRRCSISSTS